MDFVVKIYEISVVFPKEETYGLTAQLGSCVISVPSNISEGAGTGTNRQVKRFLEISMGSINEVQTQIELAFRVKYIHKEIYDGLIDEALQIHKMILALYNSLKDED
jgi:four helix bundle protein